MSKKDSKFTEAALEASKRVQGAFQELKKKTSKELPFMQTDKKI